MIPLGHTDDLFKDEDISALQLLSLPALRPGSNCLPTRIDRVASTSDVGQDKSEAYPYLVMSALHTSRPWTRIQAKAPTGGRVCLQFVHTCGIVAPCMGNLGAFCVS